MKCDGHRDDTWLVEGCIRRDEGAWSAFLAKFSGLISVSIVNRLRKYGYSPPRADVEDIKQDILTSLWKDGLFEGIRNRGKITYWVSIVAGNGAIEWLRRRRGGDGTRLVSISDRLGEEEPEELMELRASSLPEELSNKEVAERIESEIETLPEKEKLVLKLRLLHDKKRDEIAQILNLPRGTVSSYIKRAKDKLRKKLKFLQ